jgi:hypothetical protein
VNWRSAVAVLLTGAVLLAQPARAADPDEPANERHFEEALAAERAGDLPGAIRLFSALAAETDASRVRLELARVLFKAGDYRRSQSEFERVYRRDLPYPVRRTVDVFLDDIDQRIGYLRPSIGLIADSNPTAAAPSGVYDIFGAPLSYKTNARSELGVSYRIDGLLPIGRDGERQWQLIGSTDGLWFDRQAARRYGADLGLRTGQLNTRLYATVGWRGTETEFQRTSSAYLGLDRRLILRPDREIDLAASVEINRFPGRSGLRGETLRGSAAYLRDVARNLTLHVAAGGSLSSVDDSQWPSTTLFAQAGFVRSLPRLNLNLIATVTGSTAGYGAHDVFFGKTRDDRFGRLDLVFYHGRPVFGLFPGVVVSLEERRSNIAFYDYRRAGLSADFRRRF